MRSYLVQELRAIDMKTITSHLREHYKTPLEGLFWLPLPRNLWAETQKEHAQECGPYYMALELGQDWLKLELLVRSQQKLRCHCIVYADSRQREAMIDSVDELIRNRDIAV